MKLTITPQMAKDWLAKSDPNYRRLSKARVNQLAEEIRNKRFRYNGETIKLNCNGSVVDGQHRLHAVIVAGIPIVSEVVEGIDNIDEIDTGKTRTMSDILHRRGEKNSGHLAGALSLMYKYKNEKLSTSSTPPTRSQLLQLLDEVPSLREAVNTCLCAKIIWLRRPFVPVVVYCSSRADKKLSQEFYRGLLVGDGLQESDPALVYRNYMASQYSLASHMRSTATHHFAYLVKAWNAYLSDTPIKNFSWRRTGKSAEAFPRIQGFEKFTPEA